MTEPTDFDKLLKVLGASNGFRTDAQWAAFFDYADESSISRIRRGQSNLPEARKDKIVQSFGITRADLNKGWRHVANVLGVEGNLPGELGTGRRISSQRDLYLLSCLTGDYTLVFLGRCSSTGEPNCIISERVQFDKSTDKNAAFKNCAFKDHYTLKSDIIGLVTVYAGNVHLTCEYEDYPPSTFLLNPLLLTKSMTALSGLYLDITEEIPPRIFATSCLLFGNKNARAFPRTIVSEDPSHRSWHRFLRNDLSQRGALIAKRDDAAIDEARALLQPFLTAQSIRE